VPENLFYLQKNQKLSYLSMKFAVTILPHDSIYVKAIANHVPSTIVRAIVYH